MTSFLVDTDVLVDSLRGARRFRLPDSSDGAISVITRAELYAGRNAESQPIEELLGSLRELPLDPTTATEAGRLRRDHGLGLGDAVIAATALATARVVMTRNDRHFRAVAGLHTQPPR